MKFKSIAVLLVFSFASVCTAQTTQPSAIFQKVRERYRNMQTYSANGTVIDDLKTADGKMHSETAFTIILKRPNLYLVTWSEKIQGVPFDESGAIWNAGAQPYLYMHVGPMMNAYMKMSTEGMAIASATGISGGAAHLIPSLFLYQQSDPFARLINPKIEGSEKIDNDDCYKIGGSSTAFKSETFWISKSTYLIRQVRNSFEPPPATRPVTDQQIDQRMKKLGPMTDETKQEVKDAIKQMATNKMTGFSTQTQRHITSPKLQPSNFAFKLPAGAVLKKSLFPQPSTQPAKQKK